MEGRTGSLLKAGRLKSAIVIERLERLPLLLSIIFGFTTESWWLSARAHSGVRLLFNRSFAGFASGLLLDAGLRRYPTYLSSYALSALRNRL